MLKFTTGLIIIYKLELIADKDQNNTYVFTNFRINLYQVIYAIKLRKSLDKYLLENL